MDVIPDKDDVEYHQKLCEFVPARNMALMQTLGSLRGTSRKTPFISKRDVECYVYSTLWNDYNQIPVRNKQHCVLTICHFKHLILLPKEN